jgi:hypothetical protein
MPARNLNNSVVDNSSQGPRVYGTPNLINAVTYDNSSGLIYFSGSFLNVAEHQPDPKCLAVFNTTSGAVTNKLFSVTTSTGAVGSIRNMATDSYGGIYICGSFALVNGFARNNVAYIDYDGTVSDWNPNSNGIVRQVVLDGDNVYLELPV